MAKTLIVADFNTSITAKWAIGATTGTITSATDDDGVALVTGRYGFTIDRNNSAKEYITCTLTGTSLTDIKTVSRQGVETSGTIREHRKGAEIVITDFVAINEFASTTADNTFSGTNTFTGTMNFTSIGDVNVNGKSNPAPVVADTTARDALYTAPVTGDMVYVTALNAMQVYNTGTAQWDTQDVGTPAPVATTTVQGIMKLHAASADPKAIVSEEAGTSGTPVSASNKLVDDADTRLIPSNIDTTYPAGETLSAGNVVFIENAPTTAQATSAQNIGDVTANTRVSFPVFGSGTAGTTLKLNLAKTGSPSVSLGVRIETDNAGSPSGTLVDANATGTVAAASLTTSLADTTVTLAGSITIPAGQKCHIVTFQGTYGSETVNASNYYKVGDGTTNSTTRVGKFWNGSAWVFGTNTTDDDNITLPTSGSTNNAQGYRITGNRNVLISSVTKNSSCTAARCVLKTTAGVEISTANFSGDVATFSSPYLLVSGTSVRVELDSSGASYTRRYNSSVYTQQIRTNITYEGGSSNGSDSLTDAYNIDSITTTSVLTFPYTSSTLFQPRVLSKTDADFSYKVDWHGITQEAVTAGDLTTGKYPKVAISGIDSNQTGLTQGTTMYLSNTAGAISSSAGTNSKKIGKAIDTTKIQIEKQEITNPTTSPLAILNSTSGTKTYTLLSTGMFRLNFSLQSSGSGSSNISEVKINDRYIPIKGDDDATSMTSQNLKFYASVGAGDPYNFTTAFWGIAGEIFTVTLAGTGFSGTGITITGS